MEPLREVLESPSSDYDEAFIPALVSVSAFLLQNPPAAVLSAIPLQTLLGCIPRIQKPDHVGLLMSILPKVLKPSVSPAFSQLLVTDPDSRARFFATFSHPSPVLRSLVIEQVAMRAQAEPSVQIFDEGSGTVTPFLDLWIRAFADAKLAVVKVAHMGLVSYARHQGAEFLRCFFVPSVIGRFREVLWVDLDGSAKISLRMFELFVELAGISEELFAACVRCEVLGSLVGLIERESVRENPLTLLNVLQLIKNLVGGEDAEETGIPAGLSQGIALSHHKRNLSDGAMDVDSPGDDAEAERVDVRSQFFETNRIFSRIVALYTDSLSDDDPMMSINLVSLIGALKDRQRSFDVSRDLFRRLMNCLRVEQTDKKVVQVCLEVLGTVIGNSSERLLETLEDAELMNVYAGFLKSNDTVLSSTFLYSLATILQGDLPLDLIVRFFSRFEGYIMLELFEKLNQPFEEVRVAILNLFRSMAMHKFGARVLVDFPDFFRFIIDRTTENSRLCLEVKFRCIEQLAATMKKSYREFDQKMIIEFMAYVRNGPFFVDEAAVKVKWSAE